MTGAQRGEPAKGNVERPGRLLPAHQRGGITGGPWTPEEILAAKHERGAAHRCSTPGCPGDHRYAAPGRGHLPECCHPLGLEASR